jgi:hypothetical protein
MRIRRQSAAFLDRGAARPNSEKPIGIHTQRGTSSDGDGRFSATANATPLRNTSVSQLPIEIDVDPLLKDIVFSEDLEQKKLVMRIYKDIYYNDPIGGSCVDLTSTLPFSDFNLGGIQNPKVAQAFEEVIERLNVRTLLPELSIDHQVTGAFVASMPYNASKNTFVDLICHPYENCKIDPLPFYSQDPLITVAFSDAHKRVMTSDSPRMQRIREYLGPDVSQQLSNDALELDPLSTIYIPRKSFTTSTGISYFRRILPIWLLEKNLFRGTLVESARRQRGILHLTLGDGDQWEPTLADMQMAMELFQNADADPLGAVIATRMGISSEEIRQGGDFWKVTDIWDQTTTMKLRGLMVSEAFLSGEATYATADTSLTVFTEYLKAYRDTITTKLLYNKVFPMVSALNGYTVSSRGKLSVRGNLLDKYDTMHNHETLQDGSKLLIPSVHWNKTLKPEGDQAYMEMLQSLTEKGVPVPLRALAAAGGFNLDALLADQEDNFSQMKRIGEYQKRLNELKKQYMPETEADEALASAFAQHENHINNMAKGTRSSVLADGTGQMMALADRNFGEAVEVYGQTADGKRRWLPNQKLANERVNRRIAKSLAEIARRNTTQLTRTTVSKKVHI